MRAVVSCARFSMRMTERMRVGVCVFSNTQHIGVYMRIMLACSRNSCISTHRCIDRVLLSAQCRKTSLCSTPNAPPSFCRSPESSHDEGGVLVIVGARYT